MTTACLQLFNDIKSLTLATIDETGAPDASYAPYFRAPNGSLCVLISELAVHTKNLRERPMASCMIVTDESASAEIFARKRLMLKCIARFISREDSRWPSLVDGLEQRHGETVGVIRQLPDFHLVEFAPVSGTLVEGFASATVLTRENAGDILVGASDS